MDTVTLQLIEENIKTSGYNYKKQIQTTVKMPTHVIPFWTTRLLQFTQQRQALLHSNTNGGSSKLTSSNKRPI